MVYITCEICNKAMKAFSKDEKYRFCNRKCQMRWMGKESARRLHEKWASIPLEMHAKEVLCPYIRKTDFCWIWTGNDKSKKMPYGRVNFRGKRWMAHKLSYRAYIGEIPEDKLVLHTCDNPSCCAPHHLYLGTYLDNQHDKRTRGRCKGEKLTEEQVKKIKKELKIHEQQKSQKGTYSLSQIGKRFKVSTQTIRQIYKGKTWKWVTTV